MKKLLLIAALVFGGVVAAQAQDVNLTKSDKSPVEAVKKEEAAAAKVKAEKAKLMHSANKVQATSYKEVEVSALPSSVTELVAKKYNGATVSKAMVNSEKGSYQLVIFDGSVDSGIKTITVNAADLKN